MSGASARTPAILMIAYTNYKTDPRVIREAEAAVSAGFSVDFLALRRPEDPREELVNGVRVVHVNQQRYRGRGAAKYVLAYLEFFIRCMLLTTWLQLKRRYCVIHVNNMPDALIFCAVFAKALGAKLILDIHDPMPNTFASKYGTSENSLLFKLLLWQERASAALADVVVTVHEPVAKYILIDQHKLNPEKIVVIANFADDILFKLNENIPPTDKIRMVFHGSILERYGLRQAISALSAVRDKENLHLTIIGEGDFSAELSELIEKLNLGDVVTFDNRMYPLHEIPTRLAGFNLGFVPMEISSITNYALPLKLLEYLSMGLPSITVRNVAIGHYFGDEDCLYYDPNDVPSLTAVIEGVLANPDRVTEFQRRARTLRSKFLWKREKDRYGELLRGLSK